MRLRGMQLATGITDARNVLTQRTVGPASECVVRLDASGLKPGDHAGLCAFQSNYGAVEIAVDSDGSRSLRVVSRAGTHSPKNASGVSSNVANDGTYASIDVANDGEIQRIPYDGTVVYLKISYNFDNDTAMFGWSSDGESWTMAEYMLQMRFTLDFFTGYRSALYQYPTKTPGGHADFDFYRLRPVDAL